MIDLKLDPITHDLMINNYTFSVTATKQEEIIQRLKIKLLWFKGEWIHDLDYGIPYNQEIFVKGIDLGDIDDIYRSAISNEVGVKELLSYSSSFDPHTRFLDVKAKVLTDSGEIINLLMNI